MKPEDFQIHSGALTWELLKENPVWTDANDEDCGMIRPLNTKCPFVLEFDTLTLKAVFTTPRGRELVGNVVYGSTYKRVYLIEVFAGGDGVTFHMNLASLIAEQLVRLRELIGDFTDPIFPLNFQSDVYDQQGELFEGCFDPK